MRSSTRLDATILVGLGAPGNRPRYRGTARAVRIPPPGCRRLARRRWPGTRWSSEHQQDPPLSDEAMAQLGIGSRFELTSSLDHPLPMAQPVIRGGVLLDMLPTFLARAYSRHKLNSLKNDSDLDVRRMIGAIRTALTHDKTSNPAKLSAIERLRQDLLQSNDVILQDDYGAGGSEGLRSQEEMVKGVLLERRVGEVCRSASRPQRWCHILYQLAKAFHPARTLEMGTCFGVSAGYIATALSECDGRLITLEGASAFAEKARENLHRLDLHNVEVRVGRFADTLERALSDLEPVEFVFVDGHHEENATKQYFELILPHASKSAILVFDDIAWSDGMHRAWDHVCHHRRVRIAVDLGQMGVVMLGEGQRRLISMRL
jgi:predicted O-methyltransferase YrrM